MVQASSNEPPPLDHMPGGGDDLSYLIRKVTFKLHETIPNPTRSKYFPADPALFMLDVLNASLYLRPPCLVWFKLTSISNR